MPSNSDNTRNGRRKPQHEPEIVNDFGKLQPQDLQVEEAVLGALMLERDAYTQVSDLLKPESFYDYSHQLIYSAIQSLALKQRPIDMLTVTEQLRNDGNLDAAGGPAHISELTGRVSSALNVEYHARIIAQKYMARELISFSSRFRPWLSMRPLMCMTSCKKPKVGCLRYPRTLLSVMSSKLIPSSTRLLPRFKKPPTMRVA